MEPKLFFIRKSIFMFFVIAMLLCGCSQGGDVDNVQIDYGQSSMYLQEDMDSAIDKIKEEFKTWEGCTLYSISYTSDEDAKEELDYCNELVEDADFDECIVFESTFHSPKKGGDAWNPDEDYIGWQWYLARSRDGEWQLLAWGY